MNLYDNVDVWAGMVRRPVREAQEELPEWVEAQSGRWVRRMEEWDADSGDERSNEVSP
ncbi:MAG: hypothetical protein JXQ75_03270 [Phycisphaerae bacterium]|nr:hypothetical protein [Phycisphaerae bacterium]